jgi:hypothetical protein
MPTKRPKPPGKLCTPWTLHFDRDGTEDIAIICDGDMDDLVTSRFFWLPEEQDPVPPTLASMWLMVTAPKLLAALKAVMKDPNCQLSQERRRVIKAVIAEARGCNLPISRYSKNG